jgi:hypothetical protein
MALSFKIEHCAFIDGARPSTSGLAWRWQCWSTGAKVRSISMLLAVTKALDIRLILRRLNSSNANNKTNTILLNREEDSRRISCPVFATPKELARRN